MSYNIYSMWQDTAQGLYKAFEFRDFAEAFAFMERVAQLAERLQHHPRWTNEWNKVEIWLLSHEAGNVITDQDRTLAQEIDRLAANTDDNEDD